MDKLSVKPIRKSISKPDVEHSQTVEWEIHDLRYYLQSESWETLSIRMQILLQNPNRLLNWKVNLVVQSGFLCARTKLMEPCGDQTHSLAVKVFKNSNTSRQFFPRTLPQEIRPPKTQTVVASPTSHGHWVIMRMDEIISSENGFLTLGNSLKLILTLTVFGTRTETEKILFN